VIAATAINERPAAAPRLIQRVLNRVVMAFGSLGNSRNTLVSTPASFHCFVPGGIIARVTALSLVLGLLPVVSTDVGIDWRKDYDLARAEAREKGRLVLLHFTLAGRPLCKTMEDETLAHADVARVAGEKYVCVRIDAEAKPELFDATIGGRGGLATCVVDADGDVVSALHGFAGPEPFRRFLEAAEKGYPDLAAARRDSSQAPADPAKLHALGEAYRKLDSLRRAEACYRKVIEAGTTEPRRVVASCHERLARFRILRGKNLEARKHLEAYRALDPQGALPWTDRVLLTEGLTLAVERKHPDAARVLRDALQRFPSSDEADHLMFSLGFVLHQDGQDQPALETLEAALKRFPQSFWVAAVKEQIEHIKNPQPDHTH
jgi:tetratricopeptide (TPR) repeat protein